MMNHVYIENKLTHFRQNIIYMQIHGPDFTFGNDSIAFDYMYMCTLVEDLLSVIVKM